MKAIHVLTAVAVLVAAANAWGEEFTDQEKRAIRSVVEQAAGEMAKTDFRDAFKNAGVWFLPVDGDKASFCHDLMDAKLIDAGRAIGMSNVVPMNTNDDDFKRILTVIQAHALDEENAVGSLDPLNLSHFGFLRPVSVILHGKLKTDKVSPRRSTSLMLSAVCVETKRKIWAREIMPSRSRVLPSPASSYPSTFKPRNDALNVAVSVFRADDASAALAARVGSAVRSKVAALGYAVDGAHETNVLLKVTVTRELFDALGEYTVFEGRVVLSAELRGDSARTLAETTIEERGARGLGVRAAERKVADKLIPGVEAWLAKSLNADVLGLVSETFSLDFAEKETVSEAIAVCERFRKAMAKLDGVHSARVIASDPQKGTATFRVVYDKDKIRSGVRAVLFARSPALGNDLAE